jgi:hypothetical protein
MAQRIRVKRGTRAQLAAAAAANALAAGEPYLITDEGVLAVGTAAGTYADTGASAVWVGPSAPTAAAYRLWFDTSDPALVPGGLCLYVRDPTTGQWLPSLADALLVGVPTQWYWPALFAPAVAVPASSAAPGTRGQTAWDGTYRYVAVGTAVWIRQAPETTWTASDGAPAPTSVGTLGDVRLVADYLYECLGSAQWIRWPAETAWSDADAALAPQSVGWPGGAAWAAPYWYRYVGAAWVRAAAEMTF